MGKAPPCPPAARPPLGPPPPPSCTTRHSPGARTLSNHLLLLLPTLATQHAHVPYTAPFVTHHRPLTRHGLLQHLLQLLHQLTGEVQVGPLHQQQAPVAQVAVRGLQVTASRRLLLFLGGAGGGARPARASES